MKLVNEKGKLFGIINPIDLIVLCNPGGSVSKEISPQERELLTNGGFSSEEICYNIHKGFIDLLHKWALIYAS